MSAKPFNPSFLSDALRHIEKHVDTLTERYPDDDTIPDWRTESKLLAAAPVLREALEETLQTIAAFVQQTADALDLDTMKVIHTQVMKAKAALKLTEAE